MAFAASLDSVTTFDAIFLPSLGSETRMPSLVPLFAPVHTSGLPISRDAPYACGRTPHPEIHMDYIATIPDEQVWGFHCIEALEGMVVEQFKFRTPYILFYPLLSRDGMPFPKNRCIQAMQGERFDKARAWKGDIIVAKYSDIEYSKMIDASMADFPIIKNYLSTHCPPLHGRSVN
ncbi:hypothetical protein FKP32DRAFT_1612708 [Trametes sanguinea]|nr:hypothetical protein FKP32DRAFT_1612708 [Trametes sanguinea]